MIDAVFLSHAPLGGVGQPHVPLGVAKLAAAFNHILTYLLAVQNWPQPSTTASRTTRRRKTGRSLQPQPHVPLGVAKLAAAFNHILTYLSVVLDSLTCDTFVCSGLHGPPEAFLRPIRRVHSLYQQFGPLWRSLRFKLTPFRLP